MTRLIPLFSVCVAGWSTSPAGDARPPAPHQESNGDRREEAESSPESILRVSARHHCIQMTQPQRPEEFAARKALKGNQRYRVAVSGKAYLSGHRGRHADPMPGVVVFYCTNTQDGYATEYTVLRPGETLVFQTPNPANERDIFLSAFFLDYWPESENRGEYELTIFEQSPHLPPESSIKEAQSQPRRRSITSTVARIRDTEYERPHNAEALAALNITFAHDPGPEAYDGVIGDPGDVWNFIGVGTRRAAGLRFADGTPTDVVAEISENDGAWGIPDQSGVFHGYIYHNCQCVDLAVTLRYLPRGIYEVYVLAHGDAPNQNAAVEITSGETTYRGKSTSNDGTWDFRNSNLSEGNQYVRYVVEVSASSPLIITSKRDGSSYSLLNAIQLKQLMKSGPARAMRRVRAVPGKAD